MKRGRKSAWIEIISPQLESIEAWCRNGCTDEQIAKNLGIDRSTFARYKAEKKELKDVLKTGKEAANLKVENALYKRATGYTYTETYDDYDLIIDANGKATPTGRGKRRTIKKEVPPDTTAIFFVLQNRWSDKWRNVKNIEITGKDGGPIETAQLSDSQYKKVREKMLKDDDC